MRILARHITNLTDARYFAAKEVAYLAFNLQEGTAGYLDPIYMQAMREWVQGPAITGEFGPGTSEQTINAAVQFYGLEAVVVPAGIRYMQVDAPEVLVKVRLTDPADPFPVGLSEEGIAAFVVELANADHAWSDYVEVLKKSGRPCFVQYAGSSDELHALLESDAPIYGLALIGGEEEAVGVKSFDELEDIFDVLEMG
jgi:phosphoribosylanthranilate isomerase